MSKIENSTSAHDKEPVIIGQFPCTQTQLRCWILDQLKPGNPALNVAVRWEVRGTFKASTIEAAFRKVIQRHEILRTRLVERNGEPCQQVVDAVEFKMPVIDLRNVPPAQRQQRVLSIGEETAREPFDLGQAGLFRVSLLMVSNDNAFLLITAHQSCFDGYSIRVLGREVGEIAAAIDAGHVPVLPELPLQYGDFALWQEEYLASYGFEAESAFWRERLVGAPYFEVPTDKPRAAVKTSRGNILSVLKAGDFGARIENAAREAKVSLYSYGAGVISAMLHRMTSNSPVMFGTQIAGRESTELEDLIGVFINNVVMRFDIDGDTRLSDHIQTASRTVTEALNHQNVPFNKLVELVNPVRDPSRNPLISVNFNLQKAFLEDHRYGGFELISAPSQSPGVIYDLSFIMIGRPSGWRMSIEYNADLFETETIESFLQLWQDSYELALLHPNDPLSSLPAISRQLAAPAPHKTQPVETKDIGTAATSRDLATLTMAERMRMIGAVWSNVLHARAVAADDDFFQLGGHSLLALRMIAAVRDQFGIKPDLELLFKQPTLRGFTEALFHTQDVAVPEPSPASSWELTAYKHGTGNRTLYTFNHPFLFYRLANALGDDISVYNVHLLNDAGNLSGDQPTLEAFAREAIDAMNLDAQNGPVAILGLCVNGVLAMEISRQLRAQGADVEFTAVIDTWAPGYFISLPKLRQMRWATERRVKRFAYFTGRLLSGRIRAIDYFKEFNASLMLMQKLGISEAAPTDVEETNTVVTQLLVNAARKYRVARDARDPNVVMFRSRANHPRAKRLLFGWTGAVADQTPVIDLEGWHEDSLTQDGIKTLAAIVDTKFKAGDIQ
jgi:thioesterase domain-containing protein/acyl carrier protein